MEKAKVSDTIQQIDELEMLISMRDAAQAGINAIIRLHELEQEHRDLKKRYDELLDSAVRSSTDMVGMALRVASIIHAPKSEPSNE